ncbi:hypothetical protein [Dyella sp.]|uniref:hypothetical protein n=1 Tax=Dyella sp. TaxID=1869338 RepID=UPI002ED4250B
MPYLRRHLLPYFACLLGMMLAMATLAQATSLHGTSSVGAVVALLDQPDDAQASDDLGSSSDDSGNLEEPAIVPDGFQVALQQRPDAKPHPFECLGFHHDTSLMPRPPSIS